jgi:serine/threonine protein kinase
MPDHHPNDSNIDPDAETLETAPEESSGRTPRKIGQYRIIRVIGSGGMGIVYEGIQENPKRKVAIKVMRSGVTSRSAMRRFEYESQVLGRLSHPAIAKVFEAGTWDDGTGGVPYFAMEYIPDLYYDL